MNYFIYSYGCQMNTADSEEMAQPLKERGFTATTDKNQADVIIMNTCTVREHAEHKAISNLGRLRAWKEENNDRILIVAGCAASLWGESVKKKFPYVDLVSPATQIEKFPEVIAQVLKERWNWESETKNTFPHERGGVGEEKGNKDFVSRALAPSLSPYLFGTESTAYVTIMRGCNLRCSYCIVPQVRGREKYRPMPDILKEIQQRVRDGFKEVMLLGQTVNSYYYRTVDHGHTADEALRADYAETAAGINSAVQASSDVRHSSAVRPSSAVYDFADLLRAVDAVDGVRSIRFMSPHPKHMRPNVIAAMKACSKVAHHLHLPVQSGSNRLLERMKRLYTREDYLAIVQQLRDALPDIALTTDFIVGYPAESDADFAESLSLMEEIRFDGLFAFKYSPRPGTASAEEADDIPDAIKEDRLQQVLALNQNMKSPKYPSPAVSA
jgi:tRNA-2-methylthio-N6-dimethylallyladenosine synthase